MALRRHGTRRGLTVIELLTVVAVVAILLGMGFTLHTHMREAARVAVAENRLKQVAAALELYFREHQCFPPEGSSLADELAPFVGDPTIFANPLNDEDSPGEDLDRMYRLPTIDEVDSPGHYVVCFPADDEGGTIVILETGDRVVRKSSGSMVPSETARDELLAALYTDDDPVDYGDEPTDSGDDDGGT
ncbi:type II secretion system protein, partial [bacterium]|nr:type II secretion system protein [bacterium]